MGLDLEDHQSEEDVMRALARRDFEEALSWEAAGASPAPESPSRQLPSSWKHDELTSRERLDEEEEAEEEEEEEEEVEAAAAAEEEEEEEEAEEEAAAAEDEEG